MRTLLINMDEDTLILYQSIMDNFNPDYHGILFSVEAEDDKIVIETLVEDDSSAIDFIAHKLSDHIIEHVEPLIVKEESTITCYDLFDEEIDDIIARSNWEIYHKNEEDAKEYFLQLKNDIYEIIDDLNSFDLHGFIDFRLKDRRQQINEYVEYVVDQFYEEQDDKDVIDFAKNSLSVNGSKCSQMHIVIYNKTEFEIINETYERLDIDDLRSKIDIECDEVKFILSILVSYAPKKIILHTNSQQSPYLSRVLLKVFGENADICHGCEYCESLRLKKEEEENLE